MEDGYLTVATRPGRLGDKYSMLNRLRFIQLVHAQHFVELSRRQLKSLFSKDWWDIFGENIGNSRQTRGFFRKSKQPRADKRPDRRGRQ
jgi:hypothetical protein